MDGQNEHIDDYVKHAQSLGMTFPPQTYALIVDGDCMSAGAICDGDVIFMHPQRPKDGDVVEAFVEGKGKMLKRYHVENGKAVLRADNPDHDEVPVTKEVTIGGVMIGLLRGAYQRGKTTECENRE